MSFPASRGDQIEGAAGARYEEEKEAIEGREKGEQQEDRQAEA